MNTCRPTIALAMGDPAGISPELTARLLALDETRAAANIVVFGDRRVLDQGSEVAGLKLDLNHARPGESFDASDKPVFVDLGHLDPATVKRCEATPVGGAYAIENFRQALSMACAGKADAVCTYQEVVTGLARAKFLGVGSVEEADRDNALHLLNFFKS